MYNLFMKIFKHNKTTWGITLDDYNQTGSLVWGNTEGQFYESLPENIKIKNKIDEEVILLADKSNQVEYDAFMLKVNKLFDSKIQELIDGILRTKKARIDIHISFDWLFDFTKEELRKSIYHALQESIRGHWSEITSQSSFNTNALSINSDLTNWIISAQQFKTASWTALSNSKIDHYKIIGSEFYGKFVSEDANGLVEIYKWNNIELNVNKGEFADLATAIAAITSIDKYDYVVILNGTSGKEVWRFEGGDYTKPEDWSNKTIKVVDGDRYFVYENFILAGSQGPQGPQGKEGPVGPQGKEGGVGPQGPQGKEGSGGPSWLTKDYSDLQDFIDNAPDNAKVKFNINIDGTNNVKGYTELIKVGGNVLQIISKEELDLQLDAIEKQLNMKVQITDEGATLPNGVVIAYNLVKGSDGHVYAITPLMTDAEWTKNVNDTMMAKDKSDKNALDIAQIKSNGMSVLHLDTALLGDPSADIDAELKKLAPKAILNDVAYVGTGSLWQLWKYDGTNWVDALITSTHTPSASLSLHEVEQHQDPKIATAKQEAIATAATDATTKSNQALNDAKTFTNSELAKKQDNLELIREAAPFGESISFKKQTFFMNYSTGGQRNPITDERQFTDKKYVDDEIKKIPTGGGIPNLDTIPVLADPNGSIGNTFKIDNDVAQMSFGSKDDIHRTFAQLAIFGGKGYKLYLIDKFKFMTTAEILILTESNGVDIKWIVGIKVMEGLQ